MYKYILFDLDGTLTDSAEGITKCVQYALKALGVDEPDLNNLRPFIGPPLVECFMNLYGFTKEQADFGTVKYRERYHDTGIYENKVYPGVPEMLAQLKAHNLHLAVATSKPLVFARRVTDYFNLTQYFDCICGPDLSGSHLPAKADVIADAMQKLGVCDKSQVLMIGDRRQDVLGAQKCGVACAGALYGYGGRKELADAGCTIFAETPQDIVKLICGE